MGPVDNVQSAVLVHDHVAGVKIPVANLNVVVHGIQTGVQVIAGGRVQSGLADLPVHLVFQLRQQRRTLALDLLLQQHELFHIVVHLVGVLFHHGLEGFPFHEFRHDRPLAVCLPHFQQLRDPQTGFFYSCLIQCFIQNVGLQIAVSEHLYAGIAFPIAGFLQPFQ